MHFKSFVPNRSNRSSSAVKTVTDPVDAQPLSRRELQRIVAEMVG